MTDKGVIQYDPDFDVIWCSCGQNTADFTVTYNPDNGVWSCICGAKVHHDDMMLSSFITSH